MPNAGFPGERTDDELVAVDQHGQVMGERDAAAGRDQGLGLDRLVAVTGQEPGRIQPMPGQDVLGQVGGAAVLGPDPGLLAEVCWVDVGRRRQPVADRQQDPPTTTPT